MGSGASKASRAAGAAARQYPSRAPGTASTSQEAASRVSRTHPAPHSPAPERSIGPSVHPQTRASEGRSAAIDLDARDPDFASRLSELGPVRNPSPTFSPSSTSSPSASQAAPGNSYPSGPSSGPSSGGVYPSPATNPAIAILNARQRISNELDAEQLARGKRGFEGRRYLDVALLRRVLVMRDEQNIPESDIEAQLGLRKGAVQSLGPQGVVEAA